MTSALGEMCLQLDAISSDLVVASQQLIATAKQLRAAAARAASAERSAGGAGRSGTGSAASALDAAARNCTSAAMLLNSARQEANSYTRSHWNGSASVGASGSAGGFAQSDGVSTNDGGPTAFGFEPSRTASGGFNLLPADDNAGAMASTVAGTPGFTDVIAHGNANEVGTRSGPSVDAHDFAKFLDEFPELAGESIRLMACSTGQFDEGFAQTLANLRGTKVMAPTDTLHLLRGREGVRMSIGPNPFTNSGFWRIFIPKDA